MFNNDSGPLSEFVTDETIQQAIKNGQVLLGNGMIDAAEIKFTQLTTMLVERYQHEVFRRCLARLGNEAWAQDICQDTFVAAYQALANFGHQATLRTWLFRICDNKIKEKWRNESRRAKLLRANRSTVLDKIHPNGRADVHRLLIESGWDYGLHRLGKYDRDLFVQCIIEEQRPSELTRRWRSADRVSKRLARIIKRLQRYQEDGN